MRILVNALFTVPSAQVGAVRTVTESLLSHLAGASSRRGDELFILVSRTNATYWQQVCPNARFVVIPFQTHNQFARVGIEQAASNWAVRKMRADVFYSSSGALPYIALPCKTVVYLQNILFFHLNEFYRRKVVKTSWPKWLLSYRAQDTYSRWACINSLKHATEVIAVSKTMASEAERYSGVTRQRPIHVIPCGVSDGFHPNSGAERPVPRPYILSVSSLVPHKNFEACIKSFATLKQRYGVPHDLIILGSGPPEYVQSLKDLAVKLQVGESVKLPGHVDHHSLPAWYVDADAFVLTSACEAFGSTIMEAMASGTPVLASNASGLPETVGNAGMLEDPAQTETFAAQLYRVITDQELRHKLCRRALERAAEFSWERTAQATLDVMQQALG